MFRPLPFGCCVLSTLLVCFCVSHTAASAPLAAEAAAGAAPPKPAQLLADLRACKPLRKVHYWWPTRPGWPVAVDNALAYEIVRLTGTYNLYPRWTEAADTRRAVSICQRVTERTGRQTSIGLHCAPWVNWDRKEAPTNTGRAQEAEVQRISDLLKQAREQLQAANKQLDTKIQVSAILFDSEVLNPKRGTSPEANAWNAAIDAKYNLVYDAAKAVFPEAIIVWYSRGGVTPSADPSGWRHSSQRYFTMNERGDCWSISLYRIWEIGETRESFRRTVVEADAHGGGAVIPWVALGCGYRREAKSFSAWATDYPYDPIYSWMLGREINHPWYGERPERFAPWNRAEFVVFYPGPFDQRVPRWGQHFLAYCRGAMLNEDVPGREPWVSDKNH
ncbi:MAG: hypothetical protein PVJ57_04235 [Phycisphaerae bacterium]|jgi:hypothetical protein